jgi:uncharacterized protein YndB with AHSA1/START domain
VAANSAASSPANFPGTPEFTLSREFDASRDQVFEAFSTLEALKHWWGPKGFEWVSAKLDFRPGGVFHYCMRSPQGADMWGRFVYREIAPPDRIVFINSFSDEAGGIVANPWAPDWPREVLNTVTFTEQNGKTTIHMHGGPINASESSQKLFESSRPQMQQGFAGTFAQLDEYLAARKSGSAS